MPITSTIIVQPQATILIILSVIILPLVAGSARTGSESGRLAVEQLPILCIRRGGLVRIDDWTWWEEKIRRSAG